MRFSLSTRHSPLSTRVGSAADYTLFLAVMGALGAALVLASEISWGPNLSHADALSYLFTARNLLGGEGFVEALGRDYTRWPPLYPLVLAAAAGLCGAAPLDVAGPLNAAFFGLTVFVLGRHLRRRLQSRFAAVWACVALVLSLPLVEEGVSVRADCLFILTTVLALVETDKFLAAGKTRSLAAAAAFASLACQARYVGIAAPLYLGALLLCRGGVALRRRARDAAVAAAATGLPMALWMLRNVLLVGEPAGPRPAYDYALPAFLLDIAGVLRTWTHFELPAAAAVAVAAGVLAAAARSAARPAARRPADPPTAARSAALFSGFALIYVLLLAAASVLSFGSPRIFARYVTPLYIPAAAAAAFALDRLGRAGRGSRGSAGRRAASRLAAAAVAAPLCLWTAGQAAPHARRIARANSGELDLGYNSPRWVQSETLRYLRENPLEGTIYLNESAPLTAFHNSGEAVYRKLHEPAPGLSFDSGQYRDDPDAPRDWRALLDAHLAAAPHGAWVVYFKDEWRPHFFGYGSARLRVSPRLETAADFADGVVFRVNDNAAPRENPYRAALGAARPVESGAALRAAVASRGSASRESGGFDVSWRGGELVYRKEPCADEDVHARFFLHVYPADAADLPAGGRRRGFDNLDFPFPEYGVILDGSKCAALRRLPDYAVERIETGQYTPAEGAVWKTVLRPPQGG